MDKLKVAILEDNKLLLKDLKLNLEETGLVEVVAWATNSDDFLETLRTVNPDALLLDIDLGGDSMSGLDIANKCKLPVLFVSGKTKDFYSDIEELNINSVLTVEHISKPITIEKLKKILPKFIQEIKASNQSQFVYLDFGQTRRNKIPISSIVYLCADKANGADSNNKQVFFIDRKPEILVDFSFTKMAEKGLLPDAFIQIHKSFRVNPQHIKSYHNNTHDIEVSVFNTAGKTETTRLPVSENYQKNISNQAK